LRKPRPEDRVFLKELGRRVWLHRIYAGLTQQQLADRVDVSRSWVSIVESGKANGIDVVTLRRFAESLQVSLPSLVDVRPDGDTGRHE
jgi:transcriptional regulator with XRE-family HTH domain